MLLEEKSKMMDIWNVLDGQNYIKPYMSKIYRLVESQEQIATLGLVNDVYEQGVLEELIESTKQQIAPKLDALHYLLKTPFRYPPLKFGSRFGTTFEQGLFYGSLNINTALAETAYYRFVYMLGPEEPFAQTISSEYSSFSVKIRSDKGIFLDKQPFAIYEPQLTSPISYAETQQLGMDMRKYGVEVFQYVSARDKHKGTNVALFTPNAFLSTRPSQLNTWLCQSNLQEVGFISKEEKDRVVFEKKEFLYKDKFSSPAT
jgi:hypothetical protein